MNFRAEEWNRTIRAVAKLTPLLKQLACLWPFFGALPVGAIHLIMPDLATLLQLHRVSFDLIP